MEADSESFHAWALGCQPGLLRTAMLLTGDYHRAEDLVQDALTQVALRWRRLRVERPEAYARQVIVRTNISWWRRHRRETLICDEPSPGPTLEPDVDRRFVLRQALRWLTPRQRAVLVLRYYEDMTARQAAEVMGVSVGTVKSQTHLALRRLRETAPELSELLEEGTP